MRQRVLLFAFVLLGTTSSCSSCESCKSKTDATDAAAPPTSDASPVTTPSVTASAKPSATSNRPNVSMEPASVCRALGREVTTKACGCPQKNNAGCCLFTTPPDGGPSFLECSKGKTDWPAAFEARLCTNPDKRTEAFAVCWAALDKLQCGKSAQGDLGARLPADCERLFKDLPK